MKECVVIIGSYRSGTSVVAKIMDSLGINMGQRELPNDNESWYPTGSFNDKYVRYIYTDPDTYWNLKSKNSNFGKVGIRSFEYLKKDGWNKFIEKSPFSISLIWTKRNVMKTNDEYSFLMGSQFLPDTIQKQYNTCENIFNNFQGKKIIINYSELMQNTVEIAKQVASFCGVFYIDNCIDAITPKYLE